MKDDISKILIDKEQIAKRVSEIAKQINDDFNKEKLIVVCILRGSCYFFADLTRELTSFVDLEFMSVSSYNSGTSSSGEVRIIKDISCPIEGKNVIIVEDIVDTGYTLSYLKRILLERRPKCLKICALLDKPSRRKVEIEGDYVGFEVPNEFVVGYGLDYNQDYRNLPYIGVLKQEIYAH
ncbi:hypoxanthine phosphoribosyltransferase [bacterium]|nr:hypoxanthine phosphoribosyltransferase [bacterium]